MKIKKYLALALVVVMVVTTLAIGCAEPAPAPVEKINWKLSTYGVSTSPFGLVMQWYVDEISKRSEGRFEIEPFWVATLCPPQEELAGLKSGLFEMCTLFPPYYPSDLPLANLITLPCLTPTRDWSTFLSIAHEYMQQPALINEFAEHDALSLVGISPSHTHAMGNARITSAEDIKGEKIRAALSRGLCEIPFDQITE